MNLPLPLRLLLWPLSPIYGGVVRIKAAMYERGWLKSKRLKGAVISVGNLTTGGTGKTPMVIWLAEKFLAEGKRVAILSRGYRGKNGTSDEIELMKSRLQNRVAFGVGKDRFAAGSQIEAQKPIDIFILDDGFQHQRLTRDVNIVLIDASRPLRDEFLLPAGRLREPTSALRRADVVLFTRIESQGAAKRAIQEFPQMPIFPSAVRLVGYSQVTETRGQAEANLNDVPQPVFVFSGIGNPQAFRADVECWGLKIVGHREFRDHHRYSASDIALLQALASSVGAQALLTTEKDVQNLGSMRPAGLPIYFCRIAMEIPDERPFFEILQQKLAKQAEAAT
jgi:tetraacyldisaccharide 4'-kinase